MIRLQFVFEVHYRYPCFTCGENMGEHLKEWMSRGEMWKLCLEVLQKDRNSKRWRSGEENVCIA